MPPLPTFDAETLHLLERLVFGLGRLDRELRGHPMADAWALRAGMLAGAAAAEDGGLAVDRGRLLAAAAGLPIAVYRNDHGIPAALRHIQVQGAWFGSAAPEVPEDLARLAETGPTAEHLGPAVRKAFGWVADSLPACLEAIAMAPPGAAGTLQAAWRWVRAGGDHMALTVAFPLALQAQGLACRPLPGLFPRPRPPRPGARWLRLALEDLVGRTAAATQLLHGLERARYGLRDAVAGVRSSSRLPTVAELALTAPAISAPSVVRHLTRLARRGGPLGRTRPETAATRRTAVSRASAGEMLRQLADSGWLVELTGSRTHRAYVPRDLAELGIDVQPARLRPAPGREVEEERFVIPPLPSPSERKAPLEVDFTEVLSDLRIVESRIDALLAERGLALRPASAANGGLGCVEENEDIRLAER
ncbi:MAG: hypothetical protein ACRC67_24540 [Inquilinus sp.]|uniref:hypothetical protein n=1 Tax=Inquilinus sp. TaxID=1932117 RepID=UPI003F2AA529